MRGKGDSFLWFFVNEGDEGQKARAGGSRAGEGARPTICELLSKLEGMGCVYQTNLGACRFFARRCNTPAARGAAGALPGNSALCITIISQRRWRFVSAQSHAK